ncbi:MAG: DNA recombination protein RmuC [Anaerorhabdus sp.]
MFDDIFSNNVQIIILFFFLLLIFLMLTFIFLLIKIHRKEISKTKQLKEFKELLRNDLFIFQNSISNNIKTDLNILNESTETKINHLSKNVGDQIFKNFESTSKAYTSVLEQMARMNEAQENLKSLSNNIINLQRVLTDKKTRGIHGEVELYSILESVFGNNSKRFSKQYRLTNGYIADCALFTNSTLGTVIIDSKFPLENYNRLIDSRSNRVNLNIAKNAFKNDCLKHIKDISNKYIVKGETADIAYMFIPAEAVFAEIFGNFDEVIQASYNAKVYIVSPTTLMAYITVIKAISLDQERNDKVYEIQEEFIKLSKEFSKYNDRFQNVIKDFKKTSKDLDDVEITSNKILKQFKKIETVELDNIKEEENL